MVEMIVGYGHESRISVYGILGMGGIGETTLAQKIYNELRIRERFHQEMHRLKDPDGLELLMKRSFRTRDEANVFSDIGAKIVKKCDGLPLAIKVVGGVLSSRSSKEEWERILERRWSIDGLPEELEGALYLSYSDLPPQLKQCFLWCALLPQNFNIHRDVTYWWIAEGLVKEECTGPIHNIPEDYYHELIKRNLLQARPEYVDKGVSTMHDLLTQLGQFLTRNEAVFMNEKRDRCPSSIRRLGVGSAVDEIPSIEEKKRLRCLIVLHHDTCRSVKRDIFRKLVHLRISVLRGAGLERTPASVDYLALLRLLDLSYEIKELPGSIRNLTSLGCLSVFGCTKLAALPPSLMRLTTISFLQIGNTGLAQVPKGSSRQRSRRSGSIGAELLGNDILSGTLTTAFPKLELLEILDMYNWQNWSLSMDTLFDNTQQQSLMPCLTRLRLINCPKLRALPDHLHRIVNLQRIQIEGADSLQEIIDHPGLCGSRLGTTSP
ncbi:unnamed protein product [Miscanthus lutarioriparius]|uniref:NB-ARC domain-containing protein n=1 Tax=Miscanthus lutarioriparius TaxID=422564 RepID=A0A811PUZ5_9POAL|nr:unnamed protein product [Miscanthus lutarioriparius]